MNGLLNRFEVAYVSQQDRLREMKVGKWVRALLTKKPNF
jgi:hypothetical protein